MRCIVDWKSMISKTFKVKVLIRIVVLSAFLGSFLYFALVTEQYLRSGYFLVFSLISVGELFWYIDRTNRDLANFFQSILQNDFTTTFSRNEEGKSFRQLYQSINAISNRFRAIGAEKEAQLLFLELLLEHIKVAIIVFDENGNVQSVNASFKELVDQPYLNEIQGLKRTLPQLAEVLEDIGPERPRLFQLQKDQELLQLSIVANLFIVKGTTFKLVSIQNIKRELEAGEVDAWQKLIRVLTHEIMNSVTPITSLTDTMLDIVTPHQQSGRNLSPENLKNIFAGLSAIKERNQGLQTFTRAYQQLTRVPQPQFEQFSALEFLQSLQVLVLPDMKAKGVNFKIDVEPEDAEIIADRQQLGQVLINLIKNAREAVEASSLKEVTVQIFVSEPTTIIVSDTGQGIPKDQQEKIFIPFFTTKKQGSGIGLALARQIIHQHNGTLTLEPSVEGSRFVISI